MKILRSDEVGSKTNGTRYQDEIQTSYFNLIELFGLPTFGRGDKTLCEWVLQDRFGDVATIYDWKSNVNDPEFVSDWHIGGNDHSYRFIQEIKEKIKKKVDTLNLVC